MIAQDVFTQGKSLIANILEKIGIARLQKRLAITEILLLFLSCRGRVNFSQLGRQGERYEKTYRYHFEREMDWAEFNSELIKQVCSEELVIGFDPSYISKSGKHTPGLGYFYSGVAASYKRGLELGSLAIIDVQQNTAYHYEAVVSPSAKKDKSEDGRTLVDHYAEVITDRSEVLQELSKILVVDGYFSKRKFIDKVIEKTELEIICRMRDDANLKYLAKASTATKRGRPKLYNGKVDVKNIDKRRFKKVADNDEMRVYELVVHSVGLQRKIKVCYIEFLASDRSVKMRKILFSTNLSRSALTILKYYKARFQMEFVFRDAKQYTGLEHCQARSEKKLHFHFNASLTAVNIAKAMLREGQSKTTSIPLSVRDLKMKMQNRNMLQRIFSIYAFDPKLLENKIHLEKVLAFGSRAA